MSCCSSSQEKVCPMRMHDGRSFTDYRPRCITNADLMSELSQKQIVASSYESRLYLQNNAEILMEKMKTDALNRLCGPCPRPFSDNGTMLQERYNVKCDATTCSRQEVAPTGLGDGRAF